jgi:hypothetical protein
MLPQSDKDVLIARSLEHTISAEGGMTCIVIRNYPIPQWGRVELPGP